MRTKKVLLGLGLSIASGVLASFAYGITTNTTSSAQAADPVMVNPVASLVTDDVQSQISKLPFHVKQPKKIPFNVHGKVANTTEIGSHKIFEFTQMNNDTKGYLTLKVSDANLTPTSNKFQLVDTNLSNGIQGTYMDNRVVQILSWRQELVEVADSLN